jgi:5,10-methylenetetrahydrofolate reductase
MGFRDKLAAGNFIILAEMEPPKGVDTSRMVANTRRIKGRVDGFVVPEMSNAVMRMSALGGALVLRQLGVEAVMQVNCRDRNRIALQADALAAGALGVSALVATTGEDPSFGDHHDARAVHDIDLTTLLGTLQRLKGGKDMAGIELGGSPDFSIGAVAQVGGRGRSAEMEAGDLRRTLEAGAEFIITPPLFDPNAIAPLLKRIDFETTKIIPTVLLLKSLGMARYMARNMEHITIPDTLIERLMKSKQKVRECIQVAAETVGQMRQAGFAGVVLMTMGWEDRLPDILAKL